MVFRHGLLAALLIAGAAENTALASIASVAVSGGEVEGQVIDGVIVFKGIPFAAPPLGYVGRFRNPLSRGKASVRRTHLDPRACNHETLRSNRNRAKIACT
jgi:carboxylesterase type B